MSIRIIGKSKNTVIMNQFLENIGFNIEKYCFKNLDSWDKWCFELIGTKIKGIIICFKNSEFYNQYIEKLNNKIWKEKKLLFHKDYNNQTSLISFSIKNLIFNIINIEEDLMISNSLMKNLNDKINIKENNAKLNLLLKELSNFDSRYSIMLLPHNNKIYEYNNKFNNPLLKCNVKNNNLQKYLKKCISSIKEIDPLFEMFDIYALTN